MQIKKIRFKNIASYGNKMQEIDLTEESGLHLIMGQSGAGKCVHPNTQITLQISNEEERIKFLDFMQKRSQKFYSGINLSED